jgi:hypothetical protein
MSKTALIMAIVTQVVFVVATGYFFYKVLTIPQKTDTDSHSDNDQEK